MEQIMRPRIGDQIIFTGFGADCHWRTECTVTHVSDSKIVVDPAQMLFSGVTDSGRSVGGYFDQIVEIV